MPASTGEDGGSARPSLGCARLLTVMDWLCGYEYGGLLRNTRVTQLMVGSQTQRDMGRCCSIALIWSAESGKVETGPHVVAAEWCTDYKYWEPLCPVTPSPLLSPAHWPHWPQWTRSQGTSSLRCSYADITSDSILSTSWFFVTFLTTATETS